MKAFVTADWHLGVSQYSTVDDDGRNSRLVDAEDVIMRMIDWANTEQVDLFVMAGDIFHTNKPGPEEQLAFLRILERLKGCRMLSRFIIGNHDYNSKIGSSHALKLFQEIFRGNDKVRIFSDTEWELLEVDGQRLLTCYYPFKGTPPDWAEMARYGAVDSTALVCHSHLAGAVVGAEPFEIRDDAATNVGGLPVDHVWAGHFHKPQELCQKPLAFYPGSPYAVDFNERTDVKGAVLVNVFERSYKTVGMHTRRLYQIDLVDTVTLDPAVQNDVMGSIVKVNIDLDDSIAHTFDEVAIREQLTEWAAHCIASINLKVRRQEVRRDPGIKLDGDLKGNFEKWAATADHGEHADDVLRVGKEIIDQCSQ